MKNSQLPVLAVLSLCFALPLYSAQPTPSSPLPEAAARRGVIPRFVPERSGRGHRTWDLGPRAGSPDQRDYLVEIAASRPDDARVVLPAKLDGAPLRITVGDGRQIEWRIQAAALLLTLIPSASSADAGDAGLEQAAEKKRSAGDVRLDGGTFALTLPKTPLATRLLLPDGLRLERPARGGVMARLRVVDEQGDTVYAIELAGAGATADGESGDIAVQLIPEQSAPDGITALGSSAAGYGGYQCNRGDGSGTGGNDNTGLYNRYVYVGEYSNATYPRYTCDGYLRFDINSAALPETARAYQALISPLLMRSNSSPATVKTLHFTDVDNNRAMPFLPVGAYFDATLGLWNDFSTMSGGRADYGSFTFSGTSSIFPGLNAAAVADLNGRVRSLGYFAIGIYANALTQNNYAIFQANDGLGSNTNLAIYYSDYAPKAVAFTRYYQNLTVSDQVAIHNYGEAVSLNGWRISATDTYGTTRTYNFPNQVLDRHQSLMIVAAAGVNTATTLFTGNTYSFYGGFGINNTQLSLCKGDCAVAGNGVDYLCVGPNAAAPPSGTGWDGACAPGWTNNAAEKVRVDDEDTDTAADFQEVYYGSTPALPLLPAALKGTHRRSDVVFNKVLIYSGYDWFEIANYGRTLNLQGWTVDIYSRTGGVGTYTLDANSVMNPGEVMWLSEPTGIFFTLDRLHKNTGIDSLWEGSGATPAGGMLVLRDKGGRVRDSLVFGALNGALSSLADLYWVGPPVRIGANDFWELRKTGDGFAPSAANWIDISYPGSGSWGVLLPGQSGAKFHQDEIGTGQSAAAVSLGYFNDRAAPGGGGNVITVTRQVGLEEAFFEAIPLALPAPAKFVIKKQGTGSIYYTLNLPDITAWGRSLVSTGKISPPVVLDPGTYALMLYVNGIWYDAELYNANQKLSFGTIAGVTFEANWTPTNSFSTNYANYGLHAGLGTIDPPVITSAAALPAGERTVAYPAFTHTATGGYGSHTWTITAGVLPAGLTLSAAGTLSGTPTAEGYFTFTVRVTDAAGLWTEQAETFFIYPPLAVGTSAVTDYSTATEPYAYALAAYGGVPPYAWICTGLPAGLSCDAAGNLGGTLNLAVGDGAYGFNVQVTDALGVVASRGLTLNVYRNPQIITPALPGGAVGRVYGSMILQAIGGSGTITWSVSIGALPPGLTLNSTTGTITGTPTTLGIYNLTILYATSLGGNATRAYSLTVTDNSGPGHWIRKGLAGGSVNPVYSPNFATDRTIVGANYGTLYVSRDSGYYWKPMGFSARPVTANEYTWDNDVNSIAFSPDFNAATATSGSNKTLFLATAHSGVWYSDNFGAAWSQLNSGLTSNDDPALFYATDFFVAPDYPVSHRVYCRSAVPGTNYYFAVFTGVVNTVAKTISWTRISPPWLKIGTESYNSGRSLFWSPTFAADQTVYATIYDTSWHIYRSSDAALTWVKVHDVAPGKSIFWLEVSPRHSFDATLFYSDGLFNGTVRRSTDGGKSFVSLAPQWPMFKLAFPPDYNAGSNPALFATSYNTGTGSIDLLRSADNGRTWALRNTLGSPVVGPVFSPNFGAGAANDQLMIGAFFSGLLARSEDGGISGTPSDGGLFIQAIQAVAFAPNFTTSKKVFLAIASGIYYSANGGKAWKKAVTPGDRSIQALRVSPAFATDQKVFAFACTGYDNCVLWRSTDGGLNFSAFGPTLYQLQDVEDFRLSPNFGADQMIFFTSYPFTNGTSGFYRSSDGGATFVAQGVQYTDNVDNFGISPGFGSDFTIYANDWFGVGPNFANTRISINGNTPDVSGGLTWSDFATGPDAPKGIPPAFPPQYNRASGVNGTVSKTFFWNCRKTTDGGATWALSPTSGSGCGGGYGGKVFVSPTDSSDNTLYSIVQEADASNPGPGLFRSNNGGTSFTAMAAAGNPAAFDYVNHVAISPNYTADGLVLVATAAGLYKTTDWGATWTLTTGSDPISPDVSAVASDPNQAGGLFLGTQGGEVFASTDYGITAENITGFLPAGLAVNALFAADLGGGVTAVLAGTPAGLYRSTSSGGVWSGAWSYLLAADIRNFTRNGATLFAANSAGSSYTSVNGGASWTALGSGGNGSAALDYNGQTGPTLGQEGGKQVDEKNTAAPDAVSGTNAALWSANAATGSRWSADSGTNWTNAPGFNEYTLPALSGAGSWTAIKALGLNAGNREVLIGNNGNAVIPAAQRGLYSSRDGGDSWRSVSGPGSGLEATSLNVSAMLTATTAYATTDILVGVNGTTNGGVYLSGDGGEHWTQINQGFDPNNLSISSLVKTSCSGCPVQYYSGSYGSGVYTRTITVNAPPTFPGVNRYCFGAACVGGLNNCTDGVISGPISGGQAFKLCGSGFQTGAVVEFSGVPAVSCVTQNANVITCTTPPHAAGLTTIRVRNPDTRAGTLPPQYTYSGGTSRGANSLRVAKSGANANLTWTCSPACTTGNPARVYRGQNALLTLYPENYNGGITGSWPNTGAVSTNYSYFWSVE